MVRSGSCRTDPGVPLEIPRDPWRRLGERFAPARGTRGPTARRGTAALVLWALVTGVLTGVVVLTASAPAAAATIERGTIYGLDWTGTGSRWIWSITPTGRNDHLFALTQVAAHPWNSTNALAVNVSADEFYFASQSVNATSIPIYRVDAAAETTRWIADIPMGPLTGVNSSGAFTGVYDASSGIYYVGVRSGSTGYVYGYDLTTSTVLGVVATIPIPAGDDNIADFAIDSTGRLYYVADATDGSMPRSLIVTDRRLPTTGSSVPPAMSVTTIAKGADAQPSTGAIAFGSDGYLYVGGSANDRLDRVDPTTGVIADTYSYSDTSATIADYASDVIPNTIEVVKNLPDGRASATDQFGLRITGGGADLGTTGTTTGTESGLQNQAPSEVAGPIVSLVGTTFSIGESAAGSTDPADYTSSWSCVNANADNASVASGTGTGGEVTMPASAGTGTRLVCTITNIPVRNDLVVEKTSTATADTRPGDEVTYTVRATNPGPAAYTAADPAVVFDDLSGVLDDATYAADADADQPGTVSYAVPLLSWTGPLAAGSSVELTYTVRVDAEGDGDVRNVAWQPTDPETPTTPACDPPTNGADPATGEPCAVVEYPLPRLSGTFTVEKTANPGSALPGDIVTYTVAVTNTGQIPFTDEEPASFSDDMSHVLDDASYNGDVSVGGSLTGSTLTWAGPLDVGEVLQVTYSVTVDDPMTGDSSLRNVVTPSSRGGECADAGCVAVTPMAGYTVQKDADVEDIGLGGVVTYSVTVTNVGSVAYTVARPATFEDDMTGVLDDATYNDDATEGATVSGAGVRWAGPLDIGETVTVTYSVTVDAPPAGDLSLRNAVIADGPGGRCVTADGCETETSVAGRAEVTPEGSGADCPTGADGPDCGTPVVAPPGLAITGGALWVGGVAGAGALLALGLWLVARRRREDADHGETRASVR